MVDEFIWITNIKKGHMLSSVWFLCWYTSCIELQSKVWNMASSYFCGVWHWLTLKQWWTTISMVSFGGSHVIIKYTWIMQENFCLAWKNTHCPRVKVISALVVKVVSLLLILYSTAPYSSIMLACKFWIAVLQSQTCSLHHFLCLNNSWKLLNRLFLCKGKGS